MRDSAAVELAHIQRLYFVINSSLSTKIIIHFPEATRVKYAFTTGQAGPFF